MYKFSATSIMLVAICSHLCFSNYALLASRVSEQFGSYRGALYLYLVAAIITTALVLRRRQEQLASKKLPAKIWIMLIIGLNAYLASALLYYQAFLLPTGGRLNDLQSAEFAFMTRMDSVTLFAVGLLWFNERLRTINIVGAALAFSAWLFVVSRGNLDQRACIFALAFVSCSCIGNALSKPLSKAIGPLELLWLRTIWVLLGLGVVNLLVAAPNVTKLSPEKSYLTLGLTGALLTLGFGLRFVAIKHMPFSRYSVISPIQPFAALPALYLIEGKAWPAGIILAMVCFGVGECMAFWKSKDTILEKA